MNICFDCRYAIVCRSNGETEVEYTSDFEWQCETELAQIVQDHKRRGYNVHDQGIGTVIEGGRHYAHYEIVDSHDPDQMADYA